MDWKFNDERSRIVLSEPPKRPKKITATRLGSILGLNPWQSPFATWCEMCRVYKEPFVENKYTKAGKTIEPIIIDWLKDEFEDGVVSPADFYGNTWSTVKKQYDFYKGTKIFGGMWDAKIVNLNNEAVAIIEIKTSSRPQDWEDGVPYEKLVQALQYGHLEGAKRTFVAVAFLSDEDYMHPQRFVPKSGENIKLYSFDTENACITFDGEDTTISELIEYARQWWKAYVLTGISPEFKGKKDDEILKVLKTQRPDLDTEKDLGIIMGKVDELEKKISKIKAENSLDDLEKELKDYKDALKKKLQGGMNEDDEKVEVGKWSLTKAERTSVDTAKMKKDGIYDNYVKRSVSYTLREKKEK